MTTKKESFQDFYPSFPSVLAACITVFVCFVLSVGISNIPNGHTTTVAMPTTTPEPTRQIIFTATPSPEPTAKAPQPLMTPHRPRPTLAPAPTHYSARFVRDVTIPDYTQMAAGKTFVKTWEMLNTSDGDWHGVSVVQVPTGSGWSRVPTTRSGDKVQVSFTLRAPLENGTWTWKYRLSIDGKKFGPVFYCTIRVGAPVVRSAPAPRQPVCDCSGNRYDCANFGTQAQAQACYNYCRSIGAGDVHWLDGDGDGVACEWNP